MEPLVCPDCRAELISSDGRTIVCTPHNGEYEVLFDRFARPVITRDSSVSAAVAGNCASHTSQPAMCTCNSCNRPLCTLCTFDIGGGMYCGDCARDAQSNSKTCPMCNVPSAVGAAKCSACGHSFGLLNLSARPVVRAAVPQGLMCGQHADVAAEFQCRLCGNGLCLTCDFQLPGNVHVCASCIESHGDEKINPKRTRRMYISIAIAVYSTLMLMLLVSGALNRAFSGQEAALGAFIGYAIFIPAVIGLGIGWAAFDRRLRNSAGIWIGAVWNSINLGLYLLLVIVGLMRQ